MRNAIEVLERRTLLSAALDASFGSGGIVKGPGQQSEHLLVQSDGKLLVADVVGLIRYNADGSLDTSFGGGDGIADSGILKSVGTRPAIALLPNGKILAAQSDGSSQLIVMRLNPDGSADSTFGTNGEVRPASGNPFRAVVDLDVVSGGKLLVTGYDQPMPTDNHISMTRLNGDGSTDLSWGTNGRIDTGQHYFNFPVATRELSNGQVLVFADGADPMDLSRPGTIDNWQDFVMRLNSNGSTDTNFSSGVPDFTTNERNFPLMDGDIQSDGKILLLTDGGQHVIRLYPDGNYDSTFGGSGRPGIGISTNTSVSVVEGHDLLVLPDNSILVGGHTVDRVMPGEDLRGDNAAVGRLLPNGDQDGSFGPGFLPVDFGGSLDDIYALNTQGFKIVAAGVTGSTTRQNALARITTDATSAQTPFKGTPFSPGQTIQAEDFDIGGEGVAYHDFDSTNNGGAYRPTEAVDIEATSDTGGGYDVGWTIPGDWTAYTFTAPITQNYTIDTRLASPKTGSKFHYEVDGVNVSGAVTVPNTGSFQSFRTITNSLGQISAGTHVLRLVIDSSPNTGGQANFNWMKIGAVSTGDTQAPSAVPNFRNTNVTESSITLAWDAATDNVGVTGYQLTLEPDNTVLLGPDQRSFTFTELAPNRQYTFDIHAIDAAGNEGPLSQKSATTGSLPTGGFLKGEYFNNMDFTAPVATRNDPEINFNWGTGAPLAGMAPDTFSVRWTGKIQVPTTGRYTFYTTTDDGVRLWVNNQLIIDKFVPQAATEWSGSVDLVAGQKYDIRMDYFDRAGGAKAELRWSGPGISKQIVPASAFAGSQSGDTTPPSAVPNFGVTPGSITSNSVGLHWDGATDNFAVDGYELRINDVNPILLSADTRSFTVHDLSANTPYKFTMSAFDAIGNHGPISTTFAQTSPASTSGNGLNGTYFNNMDFTAPVFTRRDPTINFNWGTGSPGAGIDPDTFSVRWSGQIQAPTTGRYTFYTTSDDGMRLTVNGQRIIDKLGPQSTTEWSGSIDLVAGQKYNIVVEYIERAGGANAKLQWSGPNFSKQVVPQSNLFS